MHARPRAAGVSREALAEQAAQLGAALVALVDRGQTVEGVGIGAVAREQTGAARPRRARDRAPLPGRRRAGAPARARSRGAAPSLGAQLGELLERLDAPVVRAGGGAELCDQPQVVGAELCLRLGALEIGERARRIAQALGVESRALDQQRSAAAASGALAMLCSRNAS